MPLVGILQNKVAQNPKCNGCVHYDLNKSICEIGLAPASCGDGSYPDIGYAPVVRAAVDVASAEIPGHAASARAGANVPAPNPRLPVVSSHLGDDSELLALAKSVTSDLVKASQVGCSVHQYGEKVGGLHNLHTAGGNCTCLPVNKSDVAKGVYAKLTPQQRLRMSLDDVEELVEKRPPGRPPGPFARLMGKRKQA